jgi:hypothetical protein
VACWRTARFSGRTLLRRVLYLYTAVMSYEFSIYSIIRFCKKLIKDVLWFEFMVVSLWHWTPTSVLARKQMTFRLTKKSAYWFGNETWLRTNKRDACFIPVCTPPPPFLAVLVDLLVLRVPDWNLVPKNAGHHFKTGHDHFLPCPF